MNEDRYYTPMDISMFNTVVLFFTFAAIAASTRYLTGRQPALESTVSSRPIPSIPYWTPYFGHAFNLLWDPMSLFAGARDMTGHGIFSLKVGPAKFDIVSDPVLVKSVMQQRESALSFLSIGWVVMERFFGVAKSRKAAYAPIWEVSSSSELSTSIILTCT